MPWMLLVDPSDAMLDGARAAVERFYDVVAVDGEKDARYAISKWEPPVAVALRLSLDGPDDGMGLAGKLRDVVGEDTLIVVYGKPAPSLKDPALRARKLYIDLFLPKDLRGDDLGKLVYAELHGGNAVGVRKTNQREDAKRRAERERKATQKPGDNRDQVVDDAVDQVKHHRVSLRPGQREATWPEVMDADLTGPNLRLLWNKANGRAAYLIEEEQGAEG